MTESPPPCSQNDGNTAVVKIGGAALCAGCYYKLEVAQTLAFNRNAALENIASAEMDLVSGLRNFSPKIQTFDIPKGPIILNNIKVDNSVVGSINTGTVQTIDVSISHLETAGGNAEALGKALAGLTEIIANEQALAKDAKNALLEQVAYVSEQAAAATKDRKPGMIQAAMDAIDKAAALVATVASAWEATEPLLKKVFGLP